MYLIEFSFYLLIRKRFLEVTLALTIMHDINIQSYLSRNLYDPLLTAKILQFLSFLFLRGWSDSQTHIFEPNDAV